MIRRCKLRKYCIFHLLEAMLVFALSELFKAELQRQVKLSMAGGLPRMVPNIGKYASEHWAHISFHPYCLAEYSMLLSVSKLHEEPKPFLKGWTGWQKLHKKSLPITLAACQCVRKSSWVNLIFRFWALKKLFHSFQSLKKIHLSDLVNGYLTSPVDPAFLFLLYVYVWKSPAYTTWCFSIILTRKSAI